jgi:hypothetical protein
LCSGNQIQTHWGMDHTTLSFSWWRYRKAQPTTARCVWFRGRTLWHKYHIGINSVRRTFSAAARKSSSRPMRRRRHAGPEGRRVVATSCPADPRMGAELVRPVPHRVRHPLPADLRSARSPVHTTGPGTCLVGAPLSGVLADMVCMSDTLLTIAAFCACQPSGSGRGRASHPRETTWRWPAYPSILTYSKSPGRLSIPCRGGAIQEA